MLGSPTNIPVFCLIGPTAVGKTDVSFALAEKFPLEIISMDSAMVFREMNIGTGKPDAAILQQIPHHLIDIINPNENYSVAAFRDDARALIQKLHASHKIPLLVGGTMLYFKTLIHGMDELPKTNPKVRDTLQQDLQKFGLPYLYDRLKTIDPISAARLHPHDKQRIMRALEVYALTNQPLSAHHHSASPEYLPYAFVNMAIVPTERALLHQRIALRVKKMLTLGFVDEVKHIKNKFHLNLEHPALRSVGYRQIYESLTAHLDQKIMEEKIIIATRQLAKRQLTWLRSLKTQCDFFSMEHPSLIHQLEEKIKNHLP